MLIFEYDGQCINVYNYFENRKRLMEFKKKEIQKIPQDERVLSAERSITGVSYSLKKDDIVCFENLLYKDAVNKYHKIECSRLSQKEQDIIINKYINDYRLHVGWHCSPTYEPHVLESSYNELRPLYKKDRIDKSQLINDKDKETLRKLKYFLTSNDYSILDDSMRARMEGIININEPLYIFHLLEHEQYDKLNNKDIEEQMSLFDEPALVSKFVMYDVQQFDRKLYDVGVGHEPENTNYSRLMNQAKKSEHILRLIKKGSWKNFNYLFNYQNFKFSIISKLNN